MLKAVFNHYKTDLIYNSYSNVLKLILAKPLTQIGD